VAENHEHLNFGFQLFKGMQKDNLGYIYRGLFTQSITDNIISLAESNLEQKGESSKVKRRVFAIMVECLQNITRHQTEHEVIEEDPDKSGIFVIQNHEDSYYITTGNTVLENSIELLTQQLEKINSLEKDELKQYYKKILEEGTFSGKGGAGLGLIDMARKSGNKLSFDFDKINEELSYFYLHTAIAKDTSSRLSHAIDLENIKNLHKMLNQEDILLIFNGVLNQDSLINLLSIIENQMIGTLDLKKKVFNVMVEMLQNIVKHATKNDEENINGNPGIFFISNKNDSYSLSTGNYVHNAEVDILKSKLEHVNSLNEEELEVFYGHSLLNFEIDNSKEAGLGIIDLRLKSGKRLDYNFSKVNEKVTFFTLQISI